jgi:phosphatidylinositol glycan class M
MLLPNIYVHKAFGKLMFVLADIGIGMLIYLILRKRSVPMRYSVVCTSIWIFHPVAINVSTRGNAGSSFQSLTVRLLVA